MAKEDSPQPILQDPLSEVARKQRRTLLALSAASIAIVWADLIPKGIPMLGVDLSGNPSVFLYVFLVALLYSATMFLLYARSDYLLWMMRIEEVRMAAKQDERDRDFEVKKLRLKAEKYTALDPRDGFQIEAAKAEASWREEDIIMHKGLRHEMIVPILEKSRKWYGARIILEFYFPGVPAVLALVSLIWAIWRHT